MRLVKGRSFYKEPWYGSYHSMIDRCYRKKAHNYPQYGGRGITVCEEWHNIELFEKWVHNSSFKPMSMLAILLKIVFGQPQKNKRTIEEIRYGLNIREKDIQLASGRTS